MDKYKGLSIIPKFNLNSEEDIENMVTLCNALGNKKRVLILKELQKPPFTSSVSELCKKFDLPTSTLMHHLEILEKAALVAFRYKNSSKGAIRLYGRSLRGADLRFYHIYQEETSHQLCDIQSIKVGHYINYEGATFSFATETKLYDFLGSNCFNPNRFDAELIYTPNGIIEYYFDNKIAKQNKITKMVISLEICSEAPYFDNTYKSDITFWINHKELGTHTCDGDYGDRRGTLNPKWWLNINTQYGKLVTLSIDETGVFINGTLVNSKINIHHLKLDEDNKISFKLGNQKTATNPGGFNIFGKKFGDYRQDIILQLYYSEEN